ncbi:MAG: hypothetical protein EPO08_05645 [Rhodospirillaceae bacterium]|nr:MAG: hypothetical protein EPO08_05645 [Rhodospirillaceae bacterium]
MKYILASLVPVVALAFVATSALAAGCGDPPAAPQMPDGATITSADMGKASEAMDAYSQSFDKWRTCTITAVNSAGEEYNTAAKEWQTQVTAYQNRAKTKK